MDRLGEYGFVLVVGLLIGLAVMLTILHFVPEHILRKFMR